MNARTHTLPPRAVPSPCRWNRFPVTSPGQSSAGRGRGRQVLPMPGQATAATLAVGNYLSRGFPRSLRTHVLSTPAPPPSPSVYKPPPLLGPASFAHRFSVCVLVSLYSQFRLSRALIMSAIISHKLEESQNSKTKMADSRSRFFLRKIHKLKKMLQPLFSRKPKPEPMSTGASIEDLQNAMNEVLEARLAEDLATSPGVAGDAIQALVDGEVTLVIVNPGTEVQVPAHFFSHTPGRFSWTFLPSADFDICPRGDLNALSYSQIPEQQTPPSTPH
ncbi:hypothetical protein J6590_027139 [Homalodisca vitripennis]|nr:hypothetical protein J6590_027139 [Homalodisca vitripennis]